MSRLKYMTVKEIESPATITKNIGVFDFFRVSGYVAVCFLLKGAVHPFLQIPFMIFSILIAIFLTSKSMFNRKRRNYESIIFLFRKDSSVYKPVVFNGKDEGDMNHVKERT